MKPLHLELQELPTQGTETAIGSWLVREAANELERLCRMEEGLFAALLTWEQSTCETLLREDVTRVLRSVLTMGKPQPPATV